MPPVHGGPRRRPGNEKGPRADRPEAEGRSRGGLGLSLRRHLVRECQVLGRQAVRLARPMNSMSARFVRPLRPLRPPFAACNGCAERGIQIGVPYPGFYGNMGDSLFSLT